MNLKRVDRINKENAYIAKSILNGLTISQIADNLKCSKSTVSNRLNLLFKKYNAKTRFEFIYRIFGEIISKNKLTIEIKEKEIDSLKEKLSSLTANLK